MSMKSEMNIREGWSRKYCKKRRYIVKRDIEMRSKIVEVSQW